MYNLFGFNGKEFDWEAKGWMNQLDYGLRAYDPRIGRFFATDPFEKAYESPYAAFGNNPIWFIDPDGADTAKYLSDAQLVDAIKVGYEIVKKHLDNKTFNIGHIYSSEVLDASVAYYKEHQKTMSLEAFNEFYEQALDYQRGFKEVAASIDGPKAFSDLGRAIFNENNTAPKLTIQITQHLINSKNGEFGSVAAAGGQAFTIIMGAALPGPAGKGLTGTRINPNLQQQVVDAGRQFVTYNGTRVPVFRGANGNSPLFQLKGGEYKYTDQTVRGLSIHIDAPKLTNARGSAYQITDMPKGLKIVQQGKDPGHFEIVPTSKITQEKFQDLLNQIKYQKVGN